MNRQDYFHGEPAMARPFNIALLLLFTALNTYATPEFVDVFVSGEGGYHTYRIPAVETTAKGTVLAFAEGRKTRADHAGNDIVLRRSEDGGKSWNPLIVVATDGNNALNNPCVVTVRPSKRVLLIFQHYPRGTGERGVVPGLTGEKICRNYLVYSDDDGKTWSEWRDITSQTKRPTVVTSIASGPGNGIQLRHGPHAGRIIFPMNQGPFKEWRVHAIYSDDQGEHWHYGEVAPNGEKGLGNEVLMAELSNGRVRLNSRSFGGKALRRTAVSDDGGTTWSALEDVPALPEPRCNGGFIRMGDPASKTSPLIYSGPDSQKGRVNGALNVSLDEGETWSIKKSLVPGRFAYSALTAVAEGRIGCLFETGDKDAYERIQLALIDLDWLMDTE
jgi:sialidase-1